MGFPGSQTLFLSRTGPGSSLLIGPSLPVGRAIERVDLSISTDELSIFRVLLGLAPSRGWVMEASGGGISFVRASTARLFGLPAISPVTSAAAVLFFSIEPGLVVTGDATFPFLFLDTVLGGTIGMVEAIALGGAVSGVPRGPSESESFGADLPGAQLGPGGVIARPLAGVSVPGAGLTGGGTPVAPFGRGTA
jgi:hypothetical protein